MTSRCMDFRAPTILHTGGNSSQEWVNSVCWQMGWVCDSLNHTSSSCLPAFELSLAGQTCFIELTIPDCFQLQPWTTLSKIVRDGSQFGWLNLHAYFSMKGDSAQARWRLHGWRRDCQLVDLRTALTGVALNRWPIRDLRIWPYLLHKGSAHEPGSIVLAWRTWCGRSAPFWIASKTASTKRLEARCLQNIRALIIDCRDNSMCHQA